MIDLAALRQDPDAFKKSQAARGESVELVDQVIAADAARRTALGEFESLRANQKAIGTQVAKAQGDEKQALLAQTKTLSDQVKAAENQLREMDASLDALVLGLSNVVDPAAPVGGEDDFVVIKEVGTKRNFAAEGIAVRDHVEIGELLGAIDIERGAKVSGSRFYYLTGPGAMLELALVQLAMNTAQKNGFTPMIPPALVKPAAMEGTGFLGQAAENVYRLEADDMYLVGTAEVPLAAYHMDEIVENSKTPILLALGCMETTKVLYSSLIHNKVPIPKKLGSNLADHPWREGKIYKNVGLLGKAPPELFNNNKKRKFEYSKYHNQSINMFFIVILNLLFMFQNLTFKFRDNGIYCLVKIFILSIRKEFSVF